MIFRYYNFDLSEDKKDSLILYNLFLDHYFQFFKRIEIKLLSEYII